MNKLKGSLSAIRKRHLFAIFAVAFIFAVVARAYQLIVLVDSETGFFIKDDFTVALLYGAVGVFTLLLLVLSFLCKSIPKPKLREGRNILLGVSSLVAAAGMVFDAITVSNRIIPQIANSSSAVLKEILFLNLQQNGGFFLALEVLFAVLSAIWFIVLSLSFLSGGCSFKRAPIVALAPVCWRMLSLVSRLMQPVSFLSVSEIFFEVALFVFSALFFLTFARIATGVFTENSMWGIFGYGLTASLFAGVVTIPRLVALFSDIAPVKGNEFSFTHLALLIFIFTAVAVCAGAGFKNSKKKIGLIEEIELPDEDEVAVKVDLNPVGVQNSENNNAVSVQEVSDEEIRAAIEGILGKRLTVQIDEYETAETPEEIIEKEIDKPVDEIVEETIDDPAEAIVEEEIDGPVEEIFEERIDEPVEEKTFEVVDEGFVDFSEMLIEDGDEDDEEEVAIPVIENSEVQPVTEESPTEKKEKKESKKSPAKKEGRKLFGKKKQEEAEEDLSIKPISLADLKNKKDIK